MRPTVTVKAIRDALPAGSRERSTSLGVAYFVVAALVYGGSFAAIALVSSWPARMAVALLNGLAIGIFFIVGHDACHGSLTPSSSLNKWLGRVAFLPSLHPFAAWEYSHNALHHGFTNLRGRDPVYCPLTVDDYRALSRVQRAFERMCRSWLGMLPLYLCRIWWPLEIMPNAEHRAHIDKRGTFGFDRSIVLAFPIGQVAALYAMSGGSVAACAVGVVVPFLAFNWLIGFATFQHHTHPRVVWYRDEREWSFFRAQVQGTVHVEFPRWIELMLNNIMEHTAHHVDTKVPLYRLTDAQDAIEATFGEENVITERFTFAGMRRTFRTCQLYDYDAHRWLSFDGSPTTDARSLESEAQCHSTATSSPPRGAFAGSTPT